MNDGLYEIVEEPDYAAKIDLLEFKFKRITEIKRAISIYLSRIPTTFPKVNFPFDGFYILRTDSFDEIGIDIPVIDVLYYVDERRKRVTLIDCQISGL